ncbi:hypothetical protein SAMN04488028_101521 [Reichenbachiella agariperforans]|uniref:Transposase DDE domain-containing protein n=2 Tax=Reichenbachiella agariperforans TaxID=156994 RepID=A0A1M6KC65_REIAG|nr:hypothetical protein SAMN04488028_101521 [Reichenbachiella agariperforans]
MPSQSTYSRFFGKFSQKRNTEVFPVLQNWFFDQIGVDNITVDFDSTVITRYRDQQGSAKGYNPNKRGRNSHHPLMAFVGQTRMVANAWLRPGNTTDSSSCKLFMQETFALNHHNRATLKTLKSYCFALGAWTVNHTNKKLLKISLLVKKRPWMDGIFSQINNLSPPFKYPNE